MDTKTLLIVGAIAAVGFFMLTSRGSSVDDSQPGDVGSVPPSGETDGRRTAREVVDTLGQIGNVAADQYRRWRDATRTPQAPQA